MTDAESERDSLAAYTLALRAARWRMLLDGDDIPRETDEPDIWLLRAIRRETK